MQSTLLLLRVCAVAALQLTPPLRDHRVLGPVFAAAERAVTESTGTGESSGTGRPEWGTWCDSNLFQVCRDTINRVALRAADGAWPEL